MILVLLQSDGCSAKRVSGTKGGEYASPCPACGGKDRFRSWPAQGRYWCRGCGKKGDLIQYLRDFRDMGYQAACKYLGAERKLSILSSNAGSPTWSPAKPKQVASNLLSS